MRSSKPSTRGKNSYAKFRDRVLANALLLSVDETLPVPDVVRVCDRTGDADYNPAVRLDILPERKSERGGFSHHHHSVDGNRGTAFGGNEFCRQSCEGRDDRGECRWHLKAEEQQHGEKPAELLAVRL